MRRPAKQVERHAIIFQKLWCVSSSAWTSSRLPEARRRLGAANIASRSQTSAPSWKRSDGNTTEWCQEGLAMLKHSLPGRVRP